MSSFAGGSMISLFRNLRSFSSASSTASRTALRAARTLSLLTVMVFPAPPGAGGGGGGVVMHGPRGAGCGHRIMRNISKTGDRSSADHTKTDLQHPSAAAYRAGPLNRAEQR